MKNTATILGIVGGILGMIFSAVVIIAGIAMQFVGTIIPNQVDVPMNIHRLLPLFGNMAIARGIGALIFAIVGLIAGINVKKKASISRDFSPYCRHCWVYFSFYRICRSGNFIYHRRYSGAG